jgi:hypothetical protein
MEITIKDLGIDSVTGLNQKLKVWEVNINSKTEIIRVGYEIITYSPTGVEVKSSGMKFYTRFNSKKEEGRQAFKEFAEGQIGQGITYAITNTLLKYPQLNQE